MNLLSGSWLNLLQNNKLEKNLLFVQLQPTRDYHPDVASPREHLYEQMPPNPAFTERNIRKANAYLLHSCPKKNSHYTSTLPSLQYVVNRV